MDTAIRTADIEEEIDLRLVGVRLWSRRRWILVSVLLFSAGFAAAAFLMIPTYRATTVLAPAYAGSGSMGSMSPAIGQLGAWASLAGINLGSADAQAEESLAVLRSREFTEAFIRDEGLMPELFRKRWDQNTQQWKGKPPGWPTLAQASKYFNKHVRTVSRDKLTGLITLQIEWRDPVTATTWVNTLVKRLNAEMRSRAIASTNASVGYLERELAKTSEVETRQAINRLMEGQINRRMLANVTEEFAFRVVDRALPPDRKDTATPSKALLLAVGPVLGLMFGAIAALVASAFSKSAE